jgi:heme-degrading monooxygenase HmoA
MKQEFEAAFAEARPLIEASPGWRSLRLLPCVETPLPSRGGEKCFITSANRCPEVDYYRTP